MPIELFAGITTNMGVAFQVWKGDLGSIPSATRFR